MKRMIIGIMLLGSVMQGVFAQTISISGRVRTVKSNEALEFANVVLQTSDSLYITGSTTDEKGNFLLDKIKSGDYLLAVTSIGYVPYYLSLEGLDKDRSIGDILLEEDAVALEGVTVSASNLQTHSDRKLVFPSDRQVQLSTNGINLLQQLMLPRVQVNPMTNEVTVPGGGEVQLRINGAQAEVQEIMALQPSEVIRVEYHDNPGLRYGNAEVVLDYIVRRPETGGSFGLDLADAPSDKWGNNYINGKINHKKSEFGLNYGISHRRFTKMWRDNEEKFVFGDGSMLERKEEGEPGLAKMTWQSLNATYSFQEKDKVMFSATLRYYTNNQPHWDYKGNLYNIANRTDMVRMIDNSAYKSHRPALDLYYLQNLKNDQTLVFNVVGTYNSTDSKRFYQEYRDEELLTNVNNLVEGRKYSVIGEGIYEKKLGTYRVSGGVRHSHSFSDNEYKNGHNYVTKSKQAESSVFAEFKGKWNKLDYTVSARVLRSWYEQEGHEGYTNYTFNPRLILFYALPGKSSLRLRVDVGNSSPSLSELSAVEQVIDSLQVQRGNPSLKPYQRYRTELTYEIQKGIFYGNLWGAYDYRPKAIMDEKRLEGNKIIQTWDNQKDWQYVAGRLNMRIGPIKDFLQLSLTGGVNHYLSNGNDYKHRYTNWYMNGNVSFSYKKFMLLLGLDTNWNWFYGETMSGGENIHYALLKYSHKSLSIGVGMFNPFVDNYKQESANWSQYASYKKSNYIKESSRMVAVTLSYNFSFGRKFNVGQKRISNSDEDSGVMSTGK